MGINPVATLGYGDGLPFVMVGGGKSRRCFFDRGSSVEAGFIPARKGLNVDYFN
jgi:hypothetical protein